MPAASPARGALSSSPAKVGATTRAAIRRVGPLRLAIGAVVLLILAGVWMQFLTGRLQALQVLSNSMMPTLAEGDRLIVKRLGNTTIERGMLVVMISPDDDGPDLVKRVIGMPGDQVEVRGAFLFLNGAPALLNGERPSFHPGSPNQSYHLGPDTYFLLGDNRAFSFDSTEFGPVPRVAIRGVVSFRYAPFAKFGSIDDPSGAP